MNLIFQNWITSQTMVLSSIHLVNIFLTNEFFFFHRKAHNHFNYYYKLLFLLGTKSIDANSGLIYFKYDFGYEFGIIFPGEGRKYIAGGNKISSSPSKHLFHNSAGIIDIPVSHEKTIKRNLMARRDPYTFRQNVKRTNFLNEQSAIDKQSSISINVDERQGEPQWTHNKQPLYKGSLNYYFFFLLLLCDSLDSFSVSASLCHPLNELKCFFYGAIELIVVLVRLKQIASVLCIRLRSASNENHLSDNIKI